LLSTPRIFSSLIRGSLRSDIFTRVDLYRLSQERTSDALGMVGEEICELRLHMSH
jgi:hypothetical protein